MKKEVRAVVEEILKDAYYDWVGLWEIVGRLGGLAKSESFEDELAASLIVLGELIRNDLAVAGHLGKEGFEQWPESREDTLARIEREWRGLGRHPLLGDIGWLDSTKKGEEMVGLIEE